MSPRTGRPVIGEKKSIDIKVRIGETENADLLKYCAKHNITRAEAIRTAISNLLKKEKSET